MSSRVHVGGIFGVSGEVRPYVSDVQLEDLSLSLCEVNESIHLDLQLEGVEDGILVIGDVHTVVDVQCSRCLTDFRRAIQIHVSELFTTDSGLLEDDESYKVEGLEIDMEQLVRDVILLHLPDIAWCGAEHAGGCAQGSPSVLSDKVLFVSGNGDPVAKVKTDPRWDVLNVLFVESDKEC